MSAQIGPSTADGYQWESWDKVQPDLWKGLQEILAAPSADYRVKLALFAAVLVLLANPPVTPSAIGLVIGCTFLVHCVYVLIASRGRHLSWVAFLVIGIVAIYATR